MADIKDKTISGAKTVWCSTWTFTQNTARRAKILGLRARGAWQQCKLKKALHQLGDQAYQALERGEANPMVAPEVSAAVQKAKELKELKEKNYQEIQAIRERIRTSCVIPTPEEPGGVEENPPVP